MSTPTSTSPRRCWRRPRRSPPRAEAGTSGFVPNLSLKGRSREGPRHRSRDGCLRVRNRPRKRRTPQGYLPRVVAYGRPGANGSAAAHDLRGGGGVDCPARPGCRRPGGVVRRRRRPHRALRRSGARRHPRRRVVRRRSVCRIRAGAREAVGVRLRPRRQGAGAADGEGDPRPSTSCRGPTTRRTRSRWRSATRSPRRSRGWRRAEATGVRSGGDPAAATRLCELARPRSESSAVVRIVGG